MTSMSSYLEVLTLPKNVIEKEKKNTKNTLCNMLYEKTRLLRARMERTPRFRYFQKRGP